MYLYFSDLDNGKGALMLNIEFAFHLILQGNNQAPKSTNKLKLHKRVKYKKYYYKIS